ncbi:MAG: ABC transporter permease [Anaerolineaceae bacterium]|nr:ABC transporter permease [Anaerolineaceae bacterium]
MKIRLQSFLALLLLGFILAVAICAPIISPSDDVENPSSYKRVGSIIDRLPHPPNENALLGTVPAQWDVFHSLVWGTRDALKFGLVVSLVVATIGTLIGSISGYFGGLLNSIAMGITDGFLTFPVIAAILFSTMFLALLSNYVGIELHLTDVGMLEQREIVSESVPSELALWIFNTLTKINPFMVALILFSWMPYARIVNAQIIRLKKTEFVLASQILGARDSRLIFKHLLPNAISPVIVLVARDVGAMVALQATFVYIGLTSGSPWAAILFWGRNWIIGPGGSLLNYWWLFVPATFALILFGIIWNLLGDELNVWLNPRERRIAL